MTMSNQQAILYLQMVKGMMLITKAEPDLDSENRGMIDDLNTAIDMGINALTIMEYIGNKEGNDGKNET